MSIARTNSIFANGYNLAAALKSFNVSGTSDELDATHLATGFRVYESGFQSAEVSADGFFDSDGTNLNKIHDILSAAYTARTTQYLTAFLQNYAFGGDCVMLDGCVMNYTTPIEVNAVIMSNAKWKSKNGLWMGKGYVSQANAAGTITTAAVDGGAASATGALLHAHLDNNAATSVAVKIQHSVDGSTSWADLVNVTTMTGAAYDSGSAIVATGTTIRRYTRAVVVVTGGAVDLVSVAFARK